MLNEAYEFIGNLKTILDLNIKEAEKLKTWISTLESEKWKDLTFEKKNGTHNRQASQFNGDQYCLNQSILMKDLDEWKMTWDSWKIENEDFIEGYDF